MSDLTVRMIRSTPEQINALIGEPSEPSIDDYTVEQIETAISAALKQYDMEAVVSLLHVLAVKAPDRAQIILSAIQIIGGAS